MIKYALKCTDGHRFEGWFGSSKDYGRQSEDGLLTCPHCDSPDVEKALMAPAIAKSGAISKSSISEEKLANFQADIRETAQKARDYVEKNFDNVGTQFPEEARRIHYGETKERGIFGKAEPAEVKELIDEGVPVAPLPVVEADEPKKKLN